MTITPTTGQQAGLSALVGTPGVAVVTGTTTGWEPVPAPEGDDRAWLALVTVTGEDGHHAGFLHWPALDDDEEAGDEPTDAQAAAMDAMIGAEARAGVEGVRTSYELVAYPADARYPWRARWTITATDGTTGTVDEWPALSTSEQEANDAAWDAHLADVADAEAEDGAAARAAYLAEQQTEFEEKVLAHPIVGELQAELAELKAKTSAQLAARDSVAGVLLGEIADLWEAMP